MVFCGFMTRRLLGLAGALVAATATWAQVDIAAIGPKVGQKAIDFRLVDQDGRTQTLESVAGRNGTMLVFFRSADW